jgi:hypothetical protein
VKKRNIMVAGLAGLALAGGSLAVGATAFAAPASSPSVLKACVSKNGAMKAVGAHVKSCSQGRTLLTWNAKGARGPVGAKGANGANGAAGAAGDLGPAGPAGAKGDIGPAGAAGDLGPAGPAGAKGDIGPAGAAGAAGAAGKSVSLSQVTGTILATATTATITCLAGETAIGGGYTLAAGDATKNVIGNQQHATSTDQWVFTTDAALAADATVSVTCAKIA